MNNKYEANVSFFLLFRGPSDLQPLRSLSEECIRSFAVGIPPESNCKKCLNYIQSSLVEHDLNTNRSPKILNFLHLLCYLRLPAAPKVKFAVVCQGIYCPL